MVQLSFLSIGLRGRVARYPIQEEGSEAPLKEDGAPGHQMGDGLPLLLPSVPGKSTAKFPDLFCCHRMPTTERLSHHWYEGDSLLAALLSCACHLPVIGDVQSIAWSGGCTCPGPVLERMCHGHVERSVSASCPMWYKDICRSQVGARNQ